MLNQPLLTVSGCDDSITVQLQLSLKWMSTVIVTLQYSAVKQMLPQTCVSNKVYQMKNLRENPGGSSNYRVLHEIIKKEMLQITRTTQHVASTSQSCKVISSRRI